MNTINKLCLKYQILAFRISDNSLCILLSKRPAHNGVSIIKIKKPDLIRIFLSTSVNHILICTLHICKCGRVSKCIIIYTYNITEVNIET